MSDAQPAWARRIRSMREARGWSQAEAAEQMRRHSDKALPDAGRLTRRWKAWELGENKPGGRYAPLVAATLNTATKALFPPEPSRDSPSELLAATGMDTLEIVSRLQASDVNDATLDAVRSTVDRLCSEYARQPPFELIPESRQWLRRLVEMQEQRLNFRQRRDTLELAGWLALLVGCLEYDLGDRRAAEATRQAALGLGKEVGSDGILGWAHEMTAWFALTAGDYRGVLAAGKAGELVSGSHSVSVQLIAQQAKAYARMGMRAEMNKTLERGRLVLDKLEYPANIDNHFVVNPSKYDFYAMDCYRHVGEDRLARELSEEVIRVSSGFQDQNRWPMRIAEAEITLGVTAAREGDLDGAVAYGRRALSNGRRSLPSLTMVSHDLTDVLRERYKGEAQVDEFVAEIREIQR
ncbi:helix-turn-helix domain-containing protein [Amycolatopsis sp. NPDC054798]